MTNDTPVSIGDIGSFVFDDFESDLLRVLGGSESEVSLTWASVGKKKISLVELSSKISRSPNVKWRKYEA